MHARKIVDDMLQDCLSGLHAIFAEALKTAVGAALRGGRLSLSQLARAMVSATAVRHRVKRMDHLLGNAALQKARGKIYRAVATSCLAGPSECGLSNRSGISRMSGWAWALARRARARASVWGSAASTRDLS